MINTYVFTETRVNGEKFLEWTKNRFEYITQRPFKDKKGKTGDGVTLTLRILQDTGDYGVDKNTGKQRPTNRGQNFEATILNGKTELPLEFGDIVCLEGFDVENSYAIGFDLLMRFHDVKRVAKAGGNHAQS